MKKITILLLLLLAGFQLTAQEKCDCKSELDFVYQQIKTTESYKYQIKDEKSVEFENVYQQLSSEIKTPLTLVACFDKLTKLLGQIKDKHSMLMGTAGDYKVEDVYDSAFVKAYQQKDVFTSFPKTERDIEALKTELKDKPLNDVEGIYNVGSSIKMGVYRTDKKDSLVGVILESKIGIWAPGHVLLYMTGTELPNHYDIIALSQVYKVPTYKRKQLVEYGVMYSNIVKEQLGVNHSYINAKVTKEYSLKQINDDTQYMWLNDFGRSNENAAKRDALLIEMDKGLNAKYLIVDLRNNGGGASKISFPIVKKIRKFSKDGGKVYVLTNKMSGSNAEQTTIRLKRMAKAIQLGQKTYGAVAYGLNYGTSFVSPSGLFQFFPTDMKFNQYLKYEEVGVEPEIKLNADSDWIEQTLEIIKGQNL